LEIFETRAFRMTLMVITIIVLFLVIRSCSTDEASSAEDRSEDTSEIDSSELPDLDLAVEPDPVVIEPDEPIEVVPRNVVTHTVESGDTISAIALRYNVSQDVVYRANPGINESNLQVGQLIDVPGASLDPTTVQNNCEERSEGQELTYYVEQGDTLGTIANDCTVTLDALMVANPGLDPNIISVGVEVRIPPIGTGFLPEELTPQPTVTPIPRDPSEFITYEVQPGDSLLNIATTYGVTLDALMGANDIADQNTLFSGQLLTVPPPTR